MCETGRRKKREQLLCGGALRRRWQFYSIENDCSDHRVAARYAAELQQGDIACNHSFI